MDDHPALRAIGVITAVIGLLTGVATVIGWIASDSFDEAALMALRVAGGVYVIGLAGVAVFAFFRSDDEPLRTRVGFLVAGVALLAFGGVSLTYDGQWFLVVMGGVSFGIALAVAVVRARDRARARVAARKDCPDCAETIKTQARVCRYCGYRFEPKV